MKHSTGIAYDCHLQSPKYVYSTGLLDKVMEASTKSKRGKRDGSIYNILI